MGNSDEGRAENCLILLGWIGSSNNKGGHGYDWKWKDMHSIFYAEGPAFKRGFETDTLYNVDVYNIIARILNLVPAKNDGDPERISPLFR